MHDDLKDDLQLIAEFDKVEPISSYVFHLLWHATFRCLHGRDYERGSWRSSPHYLYSTDLGSCTAASPLDPDLVAVSDPVAVLDSP